MFAVLWQHWRQRPARFFLTLISLILSTATLVSVFVASHNARMAFQALNSAVKGLPSLDIVNAEGDRFQLELLDKLMADDQWQPALPTLVRGTILRNSTNKSRGLALGMPFSTMSEKTREFTLRNFTLGAESIPQTGECWISALVATSLDVEEGDTIQCLFRRGFKKLTVKAIIPVREWNSIVNEHGIIVDLKWLQEVAAVPGKVDRCRIFLPDDTAETRSRTEAKLKATVASSLKIKERTNTVGVADDLLKSTELGLSFASALAVAMAAYILLNTTRMNLTERRPYFAILKCVGALPSQIRRAILLEAFLISLLGVFFGLLAGCGIGYGMGIALAAVLQATPAGFSLPWLALLAISVFLPSLTLLVVWVAERQQNNVSPLESFREPPTAGAAKMPWRSILAGGFLWWVAVAGLILVQQEYLDAQWGVAAGLLALISYLLLLPAGLIPLIWILDRLAQSKNGLSIDMAKHQLIRRPERTALNAGFLIISLCGAIGLGQTLMSNTNEINRWYQRALPGDIFLISTRTPSTIIDSEDPLRNMIQEQPGTLWANALRFIWCYADEQPVMMIVREFPMNAPFPTEPKGLTTAESMKIVQNDQVILGSILAKKLGKKKGDDVTVTFNGRSFKLPVGGVNANFANGGMALVINRQTAQKHLEITGFEWYAIAVEPNQLKETYDALRNVKDQYGFEIQLGSDMRKGVEQTIAGVTSGIWSVIFISFLTGGFGIATTLAMNIIEQARDFSLIRIVGASRRQMLITVLTQAWLIGLVGIFYGLIGGATTVFIIVLCSEALLGYQPDFHWNYMLMIMSIFGTFVIVTLAAMIPAWKASKINPVEHLSYE
jgi:putative ABC transport system permease protein